MFGITLGFGEKSKTFIIVTIAWSIIWIIPLNLELGIPWTIRSITFAVSNGVVLGLGLILSIICNLVVSTMWDYARRIKERSGVQENNKQDALKSVRSIVMEGVSSRWDKLSFPEHILFGLQQGLLLALAVGTMESFLFLPKTNIYSFTIIWIIIGAIGFITGILRGIVWGSGFVIGFTLGLPLGLTIGATISLTGIIIAIIAFAISSSIVFVLLKWILYPISAFSSYTTYILSRAKPIKVFDYLHSSSLFWDERCLFPLPGLKQTLIIAGKQNIDQALEEIIFIANERPLQIPTARSALLEITFNELEMRNDLEDIALVFQQLAKFFSPEITVVDPEWLVSFARLNEASRDAARYCSPLNWHTKRKALEDMITNLQSPYVSNNRKLKTRLDKIASEWLMVAKQELTDIEQNLEKHTYIENPFAPGPVLELSNSLFVGRYDLVQQLEEALSKGNLRPTFLLNGERRMGKSSTLKQLPNLLGARYIPIFYDLQNRGLSSSAAAFLAAIADEIYEVMRFRGMRIKKLEYSDLKQAALENEASVYRRFDIWFKDVERILEKNERTLLLIFDEFEKFEEVEQSGYLDLRLLLDWFRNIIQNHLRLALLFSGVQTFSAMSTNWANYFVNVQTLKVSFLKPTEARQLITKPTSSFPSERIFDTGVVEEIIRVTGCHPFLIQAVCSALIDQLNAENLDMAELDNVTSAVNQVLESWWDTYFRDLWERTNFEQRACLNALKYLGDSNLQGIVKQSNLDTNLVHHTIQTLLYRDLVSLKSNKYSIAAPIFCKWLELNS